MNVSTDLDSVFLRGKGTHRNYRNDCKDSGPPDTRQEEGT